jgi:hypothetical protein
MHLPFDRKDAKQLTAGDSKYAGAILGNFKRKAQRNQTWNYIGVVVVNRGK